MHTLAGLSDEVLSLILSWSSFEVVTLWMAGDAKLNKRIARSCLVVQTSPSIKGLKLKQWPKMLADLKALQTLHIQVHSFNKPHDTLLERLKSLSATVEELHLNFELACNIPGSEWPKRPVVRECWNIAEVFPNLRKLTLVHEGLRPDLSQAISDESLTIFPDSLEELTWSARLVHVTTFQALPRGLQSLHIAVDVNYAISFDKAAIASLPPTLTQLNGACVSNPQDMRALPRTLLRGNFIGRGLQSPETIAALPPNIVQILGPLSFNKYQLSIFPVPWTIIFPRTLKHLYAIYPPLKPQEIEALPRDLVRIDGASIDYTAIFEVVQSEGAKAAHSLWPPNLASLSMVVAAKNPDCKAEELKALPPTLTELKSIVIDANSKLFSHLSDLPTNLVTLDLVWWTNGGSMLPMESTFPPGITSLRLGSTSVWPPNFSKLPRGLKVLLLPDTWIHDPKWTKYLPKLPQSIERLQFARLEVSGFSLLPHALVKLTVTGISGILNDTTKMKLPPSLTQVESLRTRPESVTLQNEIFVFGDY